MFEKFLESGLIALRAGRLSTSLDDFTRAVLFDPKRSEAYVYLGNYYSSVSEDSLATICYRRAQLLSPDFFDGYFNESNLHQRRGRSVEAEAKLLCALALEPANQHGLTNLSALRHALGADPLSTCSGYERSLVIQPENNHRAAVNLGQVMLSIGRFAEGWQAFRSRFSVETPALNTALPTYRSGGTDSRVLIWGDQGVGDQIMFLSMLPSVLSLEKNVTFRGDQRLKNLVCRSFPDVQFEGDNSAFRDADYDVQISLGDLGGIFRATAADFPTSRGYLKVDQSRTELLRAEIKDDPNMVVVGISWRSINKQTGQTRTIDLSAMLGAFHHKNLRLISLQYDGTRGETDAVRRHSPPRNGRTALESGVNRYEDLDGVASICAVCDLVISIGNTAAHIAAAVGTETWVLVPHPAGWRWMASGSGTPWYPSARIFRQERDMGWENVLKSVRDALEERLISRQT